MRQATQIPFRRDMTTNRRFSNTGTRPELRRRLVLEFLDEAPGSGTGALASLYMYHVESLSDGTRVVLHRPTSLNKGFDFEIRVEGFNFARASNRSTSRPSHSDVLEDLQIKKQISPVEFARLLKCIEMVYSCQELSASDYDTIHFTVGYHVDMILFVLKWMFIEQDVTYWNYSGRAKLMSGIRAL